MLSTLELHDFVLILALFSAFFVASQKVFMLRKERDPRTWMRLLGALACFYLGVIWLGQVLNLIPMDATGVSLTIPGVLTLIILEGRRPY